VAIISSGIYEQRVIEMHMKIKLAVNADAPQLRNDSHLTSPLITTSKPQSKVP
jgi:hypothetical protein